MCRKNYKSVSVVMCTYNGEKYIGEQLESICNQTYPIHEIIVQDDCSNDQTVHLIKSFQEKYDNIKLFVNNTSLGINNNFITAIRRTSGEYVAISDQDDIWLPEKLSNEVNVIKDNLLCFCRSKPFSENGAGIFFDPSTPNYSLLRLVFSNEVSGHTILMKKELLDLMPDYNNFECYDRWLALTAAAYRKIILCDQVLCMHRRYVGAATYTSIPNIKRTFFNGFDLLFSALRKRPLLKNAAHLYFTSWLHGLSSLPINTTEISRAKEICLYMSKQDVFSTSKAMFFCFREREHIFHKKEPNSVVAILRSLLFPFMCYQYFEYMLKK